MTMTKIVSHWYIEGIKEGRAMLKEQGMKDAQQYVENLDRTIKGFGADTSVGQMLRGERDFWRNQLKLSLGTGKEQACPMHEKTP